MSEDPEIERFEPHAARTSDRPEPLVWAVDTRHFPLYWFPRDCPRASFWAAEHTSAESAGLLRGSKQVHATEDAWRSRMQAARVVAYRMPEATFEHEGDGFWVSREPVEPNELVELGDLLERHVAAAIELRFVPSIWPLWQQIVASTLAFSGIRLRNAQPAK